MCDQTKAELVRENIFLKREIRDLTIELNQKKKSFWQQLLGVFI